MLLLTSGLNDCCWSFILTVDTASIVFVSSVMFACCKLFFSHDSVENVASIDVSEYFTYQLPYKEFLITIFKFCPFVIPINFLTHWCASNIVNFYGPLCRLRSCWIYMVWRIIDFVIKAHSDSGLEWNSHHHHFFETQLTKCNSGNTRMN